MITFQDFERADNKNEFIEKCLNDFRNSEVFETGLKAKKYYDGDNDILNRLKWFYNSAGIKTKDDFKANNTIPSEFFRFIVKQEASYLLANGVTIDDAIKDKLGRKIDNKIQKAGKEALITGVSWSYCYKTINGFEFDVWTGLEFIPLFCEETGQLKAGIRFYRIDDNKPYNIFLYELDGITQYKLDKEKGITIVAAKRPYVVIKKKDILGEQITGALNFNTLPIIPFYGNDIHKSTLSKALKNKIDLYDVIASDFGNNLEDSNDVYWMLKNYQGQDLGEFLADYKYYKAINVDEDGEATPHTIEVPHEARRIALEILRKDILESSMALDTSLLSGGSLTNVAIKSLMMNLDLKTDDFENEAIDYIDNLLNLYSEITGSPADTEIKFIRRALINDAEIVDNIQKMRNDISHRTALELNPYIEDVDQEIERIEEEGMNNFKLDDAEGKPHQIEEE